MEPAAAPQGLREWVSLCRDTESAFQTEAPRQVRRRVSAVPSSLVVSAASGGGEGAGPQGGTEKPGGSSKGQESVEEPAMGVAVRLLRMWSPSAAAAGFPVCDEPG